MTTAEAVSAPALTDAQRRMYRGSFLLFVVAETMIFITLFSSRFLLAGTARPDTLEITPGLIVTLLLLFSATPVAMAVARVRAGRRSAVLLTSGAALAAVALAVIAYDWTTLPFPVNGRYGEIYVLSTGYHAVHILLGAIALVIMAGGARRGEHGPANHWRLEAAAVFWMFVTVSWLALFAVFYLL